MLRNLFLFFQTILGYKQASSDGIDSDTIAFCKEDRSIHTHDTDFYCGSQKLGTAAYQSTDAFSAAGHTHEYLPLSGGTMTDTINSSVKTNTHIAGNKGRAIINSLASAGSYVMLAKMNSTNGFFTHGTLGTDYKLQYTAASVVSEGKNYVSYTAKLLDEGGNTSFPGTVTAPTFSGKLNGNANTASKWAKARTIAIGNTGKSVNGSSNVSWSLSEIGAAPANHTHDYAPANHTHQYLPLSGGTVNGDTTITGTLSNGDGISTDGGLRVGGSSSFVGTATFDSNAVMNAPINSSVNTSSYINGFTGGAIINSTVPGGAEQFVMLAKMNSTNGVFTHGVYGNKYQLLYAQKSLISDEYNRPPLYEVVLLDEDGNTYFPGTVTAPTFSGNLNGNAATASKWNTARTITIGNTGKSVDGSINVSWSLSEIGAAPANHTHDYAPANHTHQYLPLSGGTVNGDTTIAGTLSNGDGISTDGGLRVGGSSSFVGTATFDITATFQSNAIINGTLYVDHIKGNSENNTNLKLGTGNNSGYIYVTDDLFGKNEDGGESWSINSNSGYATFSGVSQSSDQRLKENIQDVSTEFLEKYWDTENGLIHEYDWKKSGKHATGMIAQELLNYIPESVKYNQKDDSYSVDYTIATCKIIGAMFKKIKELEETIHALEER